MAEIIILHGDRHVVSQCIRCGVWHTIPALSYESDLRLGGYHYCPNGHCYGWKTGTEQAEQEAIRRERDLLRQQIARVEDERSAAWRVAADATAARKKAEGELKRNLNRAGAGVCPCCNRSFVALTRHMKSRHPEIVPMQAKRGGKLGG